MNAVLKKLFQWTKYSMSIAELLSPISEARGSGYHWRQNTRLDKQLVKLSIVNPVIQPRIYISNNNNNTCMCVYIIFLYSSNYPSLPSSAQIYNFLIVLIAWHASFPWGTVAFGNLGWTECIFFSRPWVLFNPAGTQLSKEGHFNFCREIMCSRTKYSSLHLSQTICNQVGCFLPYLRLLLSLLFCTCEDSNPFSLGNLSSVKSSAT